MEMINDQEETGPIVDTRSSSYSDDNDRVINLLNGLIAVCNDGRSGFEQAAEGVDRADLNTLFREYAYRRSQFAGELQTLVQTLGGDPEESGSLTGALRRGWMNIKSVVTGKDEAAILNECERGEDSAKNAYEEIQENDLPDYVREVIQNQYAEVVAAHEKIRNLRDAANNRSTAAASNR